MNSYYFNSSKKNILLEEIEVENLELDLVGIIEQLIFSFTFRNRTIFKDISQSFIFDCDNILSGDSYLTESIGSGVYSKNDFFEALDDFVTNLSFSSNPFNLFLTGGYDSRFLLNCYTQNDNIKCFTYYYGNSFEKKVANYIAEINNRSFFPIEVKSNWYVDVPNFNKHRGLLPSHSWVIPNLCSDIFQNIDVNSPFIHGFMGDPIFGDKAVIKSNHKSVDEIIEEYYIQKKNRYQRFFSFDIKKYEYDILNDIYFEYHNLKIHNSSADIEEVFFIKKRQQMISKIIDSVPKEVNVITPFFNDNNLIKVALGLPQFDRVGKNAFLDYAKLKFPKSSWNINADNPLGVNNTFKNLFRKALNYMHYFTENFDSYSTLSPFQHEHLRVQIFKNKEYFNEEIKRFMCRTGLDIKWEDSLDRRFNSLDLAFNLATIGKAVKL